VAMAGAALAPEDGGWVVAAVRRQGNRAVQRIWRNHGIRLHRMRQFNLSNDPRFADKVRHATPADRDRSAP